MTLERFIKEDGDSLKTACNNLLWITFPHIHDILIPSLPIWIQRTIP